MSQLTNYMHGLYTDLLMLEDGSWIPDSESIQASIEALDGIREELVELQVLDVNFELEDTRENDE